MSDETKGATMVPGCRHDNVQDSVVHSPNDGDAGICVDCGVLVCMQVWRKLHPPPEPPKSWVDQAAERYVAAERTEQLGALERGRRLAREAVEECVRFLQASGFLNLAEDMRRAMLEPKA